MSSQARRHMVQRIVKTAKQTGACATVEIEYDYRRIRNEVHYLYDGNTDEVTSGEVSETHVTISVNTENGNECTIGINDFGAVHGAVSIRWHGIPSYEYPVTEYSRDCWADAIRDTAMDNRTGGMA